MHTHTYTYIIKRTRSILGSCSLALFCSFAFRLLLSLHHAAFIRDEGGPVGPGGDGWCGEEGLDHQLGRHGDTALGGRSLGAGSGCGVLVSGSAKPADQGRTATRTASCSGEGPAASPG